MKTLTIILLFKILVFSSTLIYDIKSDKEQILLMQSK